MNPPEKVTLWRCWGCGDVAIADGICYADRHKIGLHRNSVEYVPLSEVQAAREDERRRINGLADVLFDRGNEVDGEEFFTVERRNGCVEVDQTQLFRERDPVTFTQGKGDGFVEALEAATSPDDPPRAYLDADIDVDALDVPDWQKAIAKTVQKHGVHAHDLPPDDTELQATPKTDLDLEKCPTCKGNGRVEMLEHCPGCDGSGYRPTNDTKTESFCRESEAEELLRELYEATGRNPIETVGRQRMERWLDARAAARHFLEGQER